MKYLILQDFSGKEVPFIFPNRVDHAEMREQLPYGRLIAAGYLNSVANGLECHGGNAELNVKSRPKEDLAIIIEALGELETFPDDSGLRQ